MKRKWPTLLMVSITILGGIVAYTHLQKAMTVELCTPAAFALRQSFDRWCPVASIEEAIANDVWSGASRPPRSIHTKLICINAISYGLIASVILIPIQIKVLKKGNVQPGAGGYGSPAAGSPSPHR